MSIYEKVCNVPLLQYQLVQIGFQGSVSSDGQSWTEVIQTGGAATQEQIDAAVAAYNPNATIPPQSISAAQARLGLAASPNPAAVSGGTGATGPTLLDVVNAYMQSLVATDARQILWEYATTFSISNPTLLEVATGLGWTSAQLSALFTAAAAIST